MATLLLKRNATAGVIPSVGQLQVGELAYNSQDNRLFIKDANNNIVEFTDLTIFQRGVLGVAQGGTGSTVQSWVDLTSNQTIGGNKTLTGNLTSAKYFIGNDVSILPSVGNQSAINCWWGMQLIGNRQSTLDYTINNIGSPDDFSVIIPNQQPSKIGLIVRGAASQTGNIQEWRNNSNSTLSYIDSSGYLTLGPSGTSLQQNPLSVNGNINSFIQSNVQNLSNGGSASGDVVITADTGNDNQNFVDLGINNSGYIDPSFSINGPLDGYLYSSNGDMSIGTASSKSVVFFTNGTLAENERGRINEFGDYITGLGGRRKVEIVSSATTIVNSTAVQEMFIDGVSRRLVLPLNTMWGFSVTFCARRTDVSGEWYRTLITGMIAKGATNSTTALQGNNTTATYKTGASSCTSTVTADVVNGGMRLNISNAQNNKTYKWVAFVTLFEVS